MGGRMARGSSLSDNRVIDYINKNFIALDDNISDVGFPPNTPALAPWGRWLQRHEANTRNGFTTSVVMTPDGNMPLGTSGSGYISEWHTSICYNADKYLMFLQDALKRYQQFKRIASLPNTSQRYTQIVQFHREIMEESRSRNHPQ
jgi:hypothetical protein